MADYTNRFSEDWALLGTIDPASYTTEQNTGYVSFMNYHRGMVIVHAGVISGDVDIDLEQGTTTAGAGAKTFNAGGKDLTLTATTDNNTVSIIEFRTEEFDVTNGFDCLNVEATPAAAGIFLIELWGGVGRFPPVPTTNISSVTD